MLSYPKRLIEVDLPIARISAHSRREKSIRHGHISTLHIWWARRPLAACRAVICAALWPDPADPNCPQAFRDAAAGLINEFARRADGDLKLLATSSEESKARWAALTREPIAPQSNASLCVLRSALLDFIADFANWDNSTVPDYLQTSRALTQAAHEALGSEPGTRPLVFDPFAGGGSIPLEALRVGADAFASDLNPVAVLLNKVLLEFVPTYRQRLTDEVRKWGGWIKEQAAKELASVYPKDMDGAAPIAYLWARTIRCEGPRCGVELPLIRSTVLSQREPIAHVSIEAEADHVLIHLRPGREQSSTATVRGGRATCPKCGYTTPEKRVKAQTSAVHGGGRNARLFAVLVDRDGARRFRKPTHEDSVAVNLARTSLRDLETSDRAFLPTQAINPLRPYKNTVGVCIVTRLGITKFIDLYTERQALSIVTLQGIIERIWRQQRTENGGFADAVKTVIEVALDRIVMQNSSLSRWNALRSTIEGLFSKQALQVIWDFCESNPVGPGMANWDGAVDWVARVIDDNMAIINKGTAVLASAEECPLPADCGDLVFTDPPYYAAIPYADLSDVFYVWLRRGLRNVHPSLFEDELVAKKQELVVTNSSSGPQGEAKDGAFFTAGMARALARGREIAKPSSLGCIVFADATTDSWEAMLSALIAGGWVLTASWPIDTERQSRTRAYLAASLQSSVFMVCRPREYRDGSLRTEVGEWRDVLAELPKRIHDWMPRLAVEGVVGADAIFACLGPALEIFSRYSRVEKASGEAVPLREYLEHVWAAVSTEAISMIFDDADAAGLEPDARLTAMWLWTLGGTKQSTAEDAESAEGEEQEDADEDTPRSSASSAVSSDYVLEFDAARKIAQGLGIHLEKSQSIVEVKGDKARLRPVGERLKHLFGTDTEAAPTSRGAKKGKGRQKTLFDLDEPEVAASWGELKGPPAGATVLDRLHQAMLLFAAGRGELLKRFLVEEGAGADARFWKLAQSLSALYPAGTDEKRWVDGVLARKKGVGL